MKTIEIDNKKYEIIKDEKDAIDLEKIAEKLTDYFESFDYIVGDWSYGKLRLKGFNDQNNPNYKLINDIKTVDSYIKNNCAYGCKYFILRCLPRKD